MPLGYNVINQNYPSRSHTISYLAETNIPKALSKIQNDKKIHFVTHSMGGILLRCFLQNNKIDNLGRVVMLGPPNQGSEIVDSLGKLSIFSIINGPAGMQLGTNNISLPRKLKNIDFELGIIAGTKNFNPFLNALLPSPNDGKVSLESTKVEGMSDHLALPVTHTFMMNNRKVKESVRKFIEEGSFRR